MSVLQALRPVRADATPREGKDDPAAGGILIVDDDEMIRTLLAAFCRVQAIRYWLAKNGAEAVKIYLEHGAEIDFALLDVRMPGMDGPHTLQRLREINPTLVCGFMSGDWTPYTPEELSAFGASALLVKPFPLNKFARFVDDCLAKA